MIDLEGLWRDARADVVVCSETGAAKNDILNAITEKAYTFDEVAKRVKLCSGGCELKNPSGCGCRENVEAIIAVYAPVFQMMSEGGGCHHQKAERSDKPAGCTGKRTESCGGCTGCK